MAFPHYSARIGEAHCIGVGLSYHELLTRLVEFALRAAIARSSDESLWEHEELRRHGLAAVQLFRNDRAVWDDPQTFYEEFAEARRERVESWFEARNELDPAFYDTLDFDLRTLWRRMGYESPSVRYDMKPLFHELECDVSDRAATARKSMLVDLLKELQELH